MTSNLTKILIIPGMNQSQDVFLSLLNSKFLQCHFLEFPCNATDPISFKNTSLLKYKEIIKDALKVRDYDYILAHSLGGLILCELICEDPSNLELFKKVIFLGCALQARVKFDFFSFIPDHFKVPSFNAKKFRVHSFCYAFMYKEMSQIQKKVDMSFLASSHQLLFYYDPRDELLDVSIFDSFLNSRQYLCKDYPRHLYYDLIEKLALGQLLF